MQSSFEGSLSLTIISVSGDVLLGPKEQVDASECARDLKRRLPDCGGAWRLLLLGRELHDPESLSSVCQPDVENEITAVVEKTHATKLARKMVEQREWKAQLQQSSEQWLAEMASADDDKKRQQRDKDIEAYRVALAQLVQQVGERALMSCNMAAGDGKSWCTFVFDDLQFHELGAKFYFAMPRLKPIRADPILRGWYLSVHGADSKDVPDVPEHLQMGGQRNNKFIQSLTPDLISFLKGHGLRVFPGECMGYVNIAWGGDELAMAEGMDTSWPKWW